MIFEPPRTGKTQLISKFFPAWYIGKHPSDQIMQVSYKAELSTDHGRAVRDTLTDPIYQQIFPGIGLRPDAKAAGRWMIKPGTQGKKAGEYYAAGVTGGIAGRGWNLGIIDDPLSEQDAASDVAREYVRNWYGPGFYTRRQPERNAAVIMSTRWAADDLPGHLLSLQDNDPMADRWRVVEVPAVLTQKSAERLNLYTDMAHFYDCIRLRSGEKTKLLRAAAVAAARARAHQGQHDQPRLVGALHAEPCGRGGPHYEARRLARMEAAPPSLLLRDHRLLRHGDRGR
jgi:hypothetical protein